MEKQITWKTGNPPDKLNKYIVTYEDGSVDTCIWMQDYVENHIGRTLKYRWKNPRTKIIAYTELPEPYKESEE